MLTLVLKIPKVLEIKFYRLSLPSTNMSNHPLSGLYQDIQLTEDKIFPLKINNFC